jgi:hypothetical protein
MRALAPLAHLASLTTATLVALAGCGPGAPPTCADPVAPGDLVITEIFASYTAGADAGHEWFEIYNTTDHPIELTGLTVTSSRADGTAGKDHVVGRITVAPDQYFTLGDAAPDALPGYLSYGYGADLGALSNTGGKLALHCAATEIDAATYDAVTAGHARELSAAQPPDASANDDPALWCDAHDGAFEPGNYGTPGADNDCAPVLEGSCVEHGVARPIVSPMPGDLVITEVMPTPLKTPAATGEWFEAKVLADCDLNGLGLDRIGDAAPPDLITSPACVHATSGDYLVFAHSPDPSQNGGLPPVAATFTFSIIAGSTSSVGDLAIMAGATVIDAIQWTHSSGGKARALDPSFTDALANDSEAGFCDATTPYGLGDLGTPGLANPACTFLPPPGSCDDHGTLRAIVKPAAGQLVITEVMANPAGPDATLEWFEVTNTAATAFDLNDLGLDRVGDTRPPDVIRATTCEPLAPGGYAVFAHTADPAMNGLLPPIAGTFGFAIVAGSATTPGDLRVLDGATVLDAITWTKAPSSASSQLDPGATTVTGNDDPAKLCAATTPYGDQTNLGTPGAANLACP